MTHLADQGYAILPGIFAKAEIANLIRAVSSIDQHRGVRTRGGIYAVRSLLSASPEIAALANSGILRKIVRQALGTGARPVRGTLFDKTPLANWLVPWHQDLTICVGRREDLPGYGPWTTKAGVWHVQPPAAILENMVSVRIHLDDCGESNGALRVLPGTHLLGRLTAAQIADRTSACDAVTCEADAGGIVLMRPLLLHSSSASQNAGHRRVIHLDFANIDLPDPLQWANW